MEQYDRMFEKRLPRIVCQLICDFVPERYTAMQVHMTCLPSLLPFHSIHFLCCYCAMQTLFRELGRYYRTESPFSGGDVDLFVCSEFGVRKAKERSQAAAKSLARDIFERIDGAEECLPCMPAFCLCCSACVALCCRINTIESNPIRYDTTDVVRSHTAITLCGVETQRNIQIVPCGDRTPEDVLMDFDLDCVTFGFDGTQVGFTLDAIVLYLI